MQSPKQLGRIGIFYLEEAILDAVSLLQSKTDSDYVRAGDIVDVMGFDLPMKDTDKNWTINRFLDKLEGDKRVESRRKKNGAAIGWKLTEAEYQERCEEE